VHRYTEVVAKLDAGEALADDDIRSVLDQYTLVGTVEKRDQSLVLMKLLLPMMGLRDIAEPPNDVGWGSTDVFGFKRHETVEAADFPHDVREMLASPAFVERFVRANGADFRLVELANQRWGDNKKTRIHYFVKHLSFFVIASFIIASRRFGLGPPHYDEARDAHRSPAGGFRQPPQPVSRLKQ
jgi:hypothetical protein